MREIRKKDGLLAVYKDGKMEADGFGTKDDALHAIWVLEGKVYDHFYAVDNLGLVKCIDRGAL